jgi:transcriptional regulator with XRE-family HTH domain
MPTGKQDENIGQNIQQLRLKAHLTQEELASKMQVYGCDIPAAHSPKLKPAYGIFTPRNSNV